MRIIVFIMSGARQGERFLLRPGQQLRLGRTEWADVALTHDKTLSNTHFAIEFRGDRCVVRDLESTNGTWLNDQRVVQAELRDGDRLKAGATEFRIEIEGESACTTSVPDEAPGWEAKANPSDSSASVGVGTVRVPVPSLTSAECPSGLLAVQGKSSLIRPYQLAGLLGQGHPLTMIVDVNKLPADRRPELPTNVEYLLDWIPENTRQVASPVVLPQSEYPEALEMIEPIWGKDTAICLFSKSDNASLLKKLRPLGGLLTRPSVLAQHLNNSDSSFVDDLFQTVHAALIESETSESWTLFGGPEITAQLDELALGHPTQPA